MPNHKSPLAAAFTVLGTLFATHARAPARVLASLSSTLLLSFALAPYSAAAQDADFEDTAEEAGATPGQVLAAAPAEHWKPIPVSDLLIFTLPDAADGTKRETVIQLLPAKLSGGHVRNVRKLAKGRWWDGTKIYRVAKNFVTQFGGNPDRKKLPKGLETVPESEYFNEQLGENLFTDSTVLNRMISYSNTYEGTDIKPLMKTIYENAGAKEVGFGAGWPIGMKGGKAYPITCRGSLSPAHYDPPDAGTGAEISIITGEAARSLDTTFGMVGRVIDGLEHVQNLPLGDAPGGFYSDKSKYIKIQSVRLASELPLADQPRYEYLASYSPSLLQYIEARSKNGGGYGNIGTVDYPIRKVSN